MIHDLRKNQVVDRAGLRRWLERSAAESALRCGFVPGFRVNCNETPSRMVVLKFSDIVDPPYVIADTVDFLGSPTQFASANLFT